MERASLCGSSQRAAGEETSTARSTRPCLVHPYRPPHETWPLGIAVAARKVNPDLQEGLPWPLVRRVPQAAHAVNAKAVGAFLPLIVG